MPNTFDGHRNRPEAAADFEGVPTVTQSLLMIAVLVAALVGIFAFRAAQNRRTDRELTTLATPDVSGGPVDTWRSTILALQARLVRWDRERWADAMSGWKKEAAAFRDVCQSLVAMQPSVPNAAGDPSVVLAAWDDALATGTTASRKEATRLTRIYVRETGLVASDFEPCPQCGSSASAAVGWTWWGGGLGPILLTHVRCSVCGAQYNGKTGQSNTRLILLYGIVGVAMGVALVFMIR